MTDKGQEQSRLRGFPLFTILGFEIRLNLSWLLLGLLITWTLAEGFFPQRYPDLGAQARWWMGVAGAVGVKADVNPIRRGRIEVEADVEVRRHIQVDRVEKEISDTFLDDLASNL